MAVDLTSGDLRRIADFLDLIAPPGRESVVLSGYSGVYATLPGGKLVRVEWRDIGDGPHYVAVVGEE